MWEKQRKLEEETRASREGKEVKGGEGEWLGCNPGDDGLSRTSEGRRVRGCVLALAALAIPARIWSTSGSCMRVNARTFLKLIARLHFKQSE
jgi:hypothetical protein